MELTSKSTQLTLSDAACNLCAKRDGCMPYSDEDLLFGVNNGHVPALGECKIYISGNYQQKENALNNLNDFNEYAKNLVKGNYAK